MRDRRRVLTGVSLLLLVLAVILVVALSSAGGRGRSAPKPGAVPPLETGITATAAAMAGCTEVRTVQMQIVADEPATVVQAHANAAVADLDIAVEKDLSWRSLQSGVQLLADSLESDNADQATLGITIARYQCGRVDVVLPGAITAAPTATG